MELRRDVRLGLGALLVALMLSCVGAVGLLTRMSPAIERILSENDYSLEVADQVLSMLVLAEGNPEPEAMRARAAEALERARRNITEQEEQLALDSLQRHLDKALAGDRDARQAAVESLGRLAAINRAAMRRADDEAKRLGTAGAWAMVLLGLVGFATGLVVTRRLLRRVVEPVAELQEVLSAAASDNPHRRCHVFDTASELASAMRMVNDLLDERMRDGQDGPEDGCGSRT